MKAREYKHFFILHSKVQNSASIEPFVETDCKRVNILCTDPNIFATFFIIGFHQNL